MTEDLKSHLKENPQIGNVWVNSKNEWLFFPHKGFDTKYSRDEILDMEISNPETEPKEVKALIAKAKVVSVKVKPQAKQKIKKGAEKTEEPAKNDEKITE